MVAVFTCLALHRSTRNYGLPETRGYVIYRTFPNNLNEMEKNMETGIVEGLIGNGTS